MKKLYCNPVSGITLNTGEFELDRAFRIALGDLYGNITRYRSGLLEEPEPCLMAGLSYPDPWTRDAAFNTWNGCGLLIPDVMKNTLLSCLTRGDDAAGMGTGCHDEEGSGVPANQLSIGGQYWDRIIWTIGAWSLYCTTGDQDFLSLAFEAVRNSLVYLEKNEWDEKMGLFRGAACIHDGVSSYGDVYIDQDGGAIFEWPASNPDRRHPKGAGLPMFVLSTNWLYDKSYRLAGKMAAELGVDPDPKWEEMRGRIKDSIRENLWEKDRNHLRFYLDPWGGCQGRQECLGNAFALLFDLVPPARKENVIENQPRLPYGPPAVWPEWERYQNMDADPYYCPPDREDIAAEIQVLRGDPRYKKAYTGHGGVIWPLIQGIWGQVMAACGCGDLFGKDLRLMANQMCRAVQSPEVVHPDCGLPYGGWQERSGQAPIDRWVSGYRQSWTASSYLRMILHGLLGLELRPKELVLKPCLPEGIEKIELSGLPYRNASVDIEVFRDPQGGDGPNNTDRADRIVPAADIREHHKIKLKK